MRVGVGDADGLRDARGGGRAVAGEQDRPDAELLEPGDGGGRLGLQAVVEEQYARRDAVDGHEEHRAAPRPLAHNRVGAAQRSVGRRRRRRVLRRAVLRVFRIAGLRGRLGGRLLPAFERGAHPRRHVRVVLCFFPVSRAAAERRAQEGGVADANEAALHRRAHAVAAVALVARRLRQRLARRDKVGDAPLVARDQRARQRVVVLVLDRRHPPVERLPRVLRTHQRLEREQLKLPRRQRARLVEADRHDPRERLQGRRVLDEQPVAAGEQRERRALHKRRGAEQRARAPRDEHDQKLLEPLVAAERDGEAEHRRRVPRGEAADQRLGLRQRRLCVLDGIVDARLEGGGDGGLGLDVDVPARDDRSGDDAVARPLALRHRLAGDAALVDGRRAGDDDAVGGHHVADAQHEDVAHREIREEDAAAAGHVDGERLRDDRAAELAADRLEREHLDQVHQRDERADRRRLDHLALRERARHRDRHHQLDVGRPAEDGEVRLLEQREAQRDGRQPQPKRRLAELDALQRDGGGEEHELRRVHRQPHRLRVGEAAADALDLDRAVDERRAQVLGVEQVDELVRRQHIAVLHVHALVRERNLHLGHRLHRIEKVADHLRLHAAAHVVDADDGAAQHRVRGVCGGVCGGVWRRRRVATRSGGVGGDEIARADATTSSRRREAPVACAL